MAAYDCFALGTDVQEPRLDIRRQCMTQGVPVDNDRKRCLRTRDESTFHCFEVGGPSIDAILLRPASI
jgi:hypothetical protein